MTGPYIAFLVTYFPRGGDRGGAVYTSDPHAVAPHEGVALRVVAADGFSVSGVRAQLQGSRDRIQWASLGSAFAPESGSVSFATQDDLPPQVRVVVTVAGADDVVTMSVKAIGGEG